MNIEDSTLALFFEDGYPVVLGYYFDTVILDVETLKIIPPDTLDQDFIVEMKDIAPELVSGLLFFLFPEGWAIATYDENSGAIKIIYTEDKHLIAAPVRFFAVGVIPGVKTNTRDINDLNTIFSAIRRSETKSLIELDEIIDTLYLKGKISGRWYLDDETKGQLEDSSNYLMKEQD